MAKSHPFSIYLLKQAFNETNSLRDGHGLLPAEADQIPENSILYILDAAPKPPWWRSFFGVQQELLQQHKGALLFLPVNGRWFALSFGQVFHHLKDEAYEYDFGLLVTLNSLDPKELKSADSVEPGASRRRRTQVPVAADLTYLDFNGNSDIIRSLTGKVKKEYEAIFKNATGSVALKVGLKLEPNELIATCETLLSLYQSEDYKAAFPNIQNIVPVKDPVDIVTMDASLVEAVRSKDDGVTLSIPEIIDYRDNTCCVFTGNGETSDIFPDISIEHFYEFIGDAVAGITIDDLHRYRMLLTDVDGNVVGGHSIYRSLIFDAIPGGQLSHFHLCEGDWYKAESGFVARLTTYLDAKCASTDLVPYNHDGEKDGRAIYSEENYNEAVPVASPAFVCLDQTNISPSGNTEIEPCDLYRVVDDPSVASGKRAEFYHLKISTRSSQLSHLFSQGVNAIELIALEAEARQKLSELIVEHLGQNNQADYLAPLAALDAKVVFGIISHKDGSARSANIPLFSKISLMRSMQRLDLYRVQSALTFIEDQSPKKGGHSKHKFILVQVAALDEHSTGVCQIVDGAVDISKLVKGCPKIVKESPVGSKFKLAVKTATDGSLSSFHKWPFEAVP